jgi:hypothetical protein
VKRKITLVFGLISAASGALFAAGKAAFNNPQAAEAIGMRQSLHQKGLAAIDTDAEPMASFIAG